jgi:hypothetical protein
MLQHLKFIEEDPEMFLFVDGIQDGHRELM